jgi:hypothetical protein
MPVQKTKLLSLSYRHPRRLGTWRGGVHFHFCKKTTPVYNFEKNYQLYSSRLAPQGREGAMIICRN